MSFDQYKFRTFAERVTWLIGQIPEGSVSTYGRIAFFAGNGRAARAVGNILRNSFGLPWQRVVNSTGRVSSKGDIARAELQRTLLESEGIVFQKERLSLDTYLWKPEIYYWANE